MLDHSIVAALKRQQCLHALTRLVIKYPAVSAYCESLSLWYVGIEHEVSFVHCDCESLALTLVRAQLWPSTPQRPRLAFTFCLLDWAEALLLECQVALKDFCSALDFYAPYVVPKVNNCYSCKTMI